MDSNSQSLINYNSDEKKDKKPEDELRREKKFDLWGPMWIMITLQVLTFVFAEVSQMIEELFGLRIEKKKTLKVKSTAVIVWGYSALVPLGLWAYFRFLGNQSI